MAQDLNVVKPGVQTIPPNDSATFQVGTDPTSFGDASVELFMPQRFVKALPTGTQRYSVVVVDKDGNVALHDTNDLQVEFSRAAHLCVTAEQKKDSKSALPVDEALACVSGLAFGGLPLVEGKTAFRHLWADFDYWRLCNSVSPAEALVTDLGLASKAGFTIDVLRKSPLVAAVRGFVSPQVRRPGPARRAHLTGRP
jgi:hypothetical protein